METLTVLVLGKGGVGKSSTVNSMVGEKVTAANAFQVSSRKRMSRLLVINVVHILIYLSCRWTVRDHEANFVLPYEVRVYSEHH